MIDSWVITLAIIILVPLIVASLASRSIKEIDLNLYILCLGMTISLCVWVDILEVYFFVVPAGLYAFMIFRGDEDA
jgi:Ca2+/Na+ antiporter